MIEVIVDKSEARILGQFRNINKLIIVKMAASVRILSEFINTYFHEFINYMILTVTTLKACM